MSAPVLTEQDLRELQAAVMAATLTGELEGIRAALRRAFSLGVERATAAEPDEPEAQHDAGTWQKARVTELERELAASMEYVGLCESTITNRESTIEWQAKLIAELEATQHAEQLRELHARIASLTQSLADAHALIDRIRSGERVELPPAHRARYIPFV